MSTLIGVWEATKSARAAKAGTTVEIDEGNKVKMTGKYDGKEEIHEGTYSIEGDKITFVMKQGDRKVETLKELTDTKLVVECEGRTIEFKRKK